ncbi:class I SAM-dependent methyltransferase [Foetidibacter luteolus]|uniref:class I SAM-dependent methyltransferase n=1 Tax=Foetidibacter luteolus TaxID=2608880 RepID=UPI00129A8CF9|nr:class I SAM-dependent methyltransferase [Foetidibacter luteolus]
MQLHNALEMLKHPQVDGARQTWAELGCGSGTFTLALAAILQQDSMIHAMDSDNAGLSKIPDNYQGVNIQKWQGDFVKDGLPFNDVDGVLMANSLHYVKDKKLFLKKAAAHIKAPGYFMIVEYNTTTSNAWVPYPVCFTALKQLFENAGYHQVEKLKEYPSVYGETMYSALVRR